MPVYRTDDPVSDFNRHEQEVEDALSLLPVCEICGERIEDDYLYEINDELICERCLNEEFRKRTEYFIGDYYGE